MNSNGKVNSHERHLEKTEIPDLCFFHGTLLERIDNIRLVSLYPI